MNVSLRMLSAGHCVHPEATVMQGGSWRPCRMPALVGLIEHPVHGFLLFDTGYSEHFLRETRHYPERFYAHLTPVRFRPEDGVAVQLAALGLHTTEIRHVVLSHFHADHVGALEDFPSARFVCSGAGYRAISGLRGLAALRRGLLPGLMPADFARRVVPFEGLPEVGFGPELAGLGPGYDLFGDRSLVALELPGHAEGHYGLLAQTDDGPTLLIGDAAWTSRAIDELRLPSRLAQAIFLDRGRYRQTLEALHVLRLDRPEIRIVPSHCDALWTELCASPPPAPAVT